MRGNMERKGKATVTSVTMNLQDVLYVLYLLPTTRVRPLVPDVLPLATVAGDNVFVALVMFRSTVVKASLVPTPHIAFDQINVRTYVVDPRTGQYAVYFIHCGIGSVLVTVLYRLVSGMPVEHIPFTIGTQRDDSMRYAQYRASGRWRGDVLIEAEEIAPQVEEISPFSSMYEAMGYLVDTFIGFYGPRNHLRRIEVWHPHTAPRLARAAEARCPILTALGLAEEEEIQQPHNGLLVMGWPFVTYLPPGGLQI